MGTGNAMQPPDGKAAGEALQDGHAPTGQAPRGAGRGVGLSADHVGRLSRASGLSSVSLIIIALTVVGVVVGAAVHSGMLFLSYAPSNPFSEQHAAGINTYVSPEFAQGWKLFAPN